MILHIQNLRKNYAKRIIPVINRGMNTENECSKISKPLEIIYTNFDGNLTLLFICFSFPLIFKRLPYCNSIQANHF